MNFKIGIVLFNKSAFGGAPKRFTNLFMSLAGKYPGNVYFFVDSTLFEQIKQIFPSLPLPYIKVIGEKKTEAKNKELYKSNSPNFIPGTIPDPLEVDKSHSLLRKIYWYHKNKLKQKKLFSELENYRKELDIKIFHGVFSGVLPLIFYMEEQPRKTAVIFSDMDSWFSDVHSDMKKLWYRKYYSFNYALENADVVDFLSPFILEGVRKRNVKVSPQSIAIAPCSFSDYSKCKIGSKGNFEIAFCGRLEPDKNPLLFLEAANIIHKKYHDIKFHILGEGTLVNEIKHFIKENNLDNIVNFQFHKNPPEIFSKTSVFVSLQSQTNYPSQSVLEAMACGNAVIASNRGDTSLFINEKNGVLVELNAEEISSAMEDMINNPGKTKEMGLYARRFVIENHTIENMLAYYLGLYNDAYNKIFNKKTEL